MEATSLDKIANAESRNMLEMWWVISMNFDFTYQTILGSVSGWNANQIFCDRDVNGHSFNGIIYKMGVNINITNIHTHTNTHVREKENWNRMALIAIYSPCLHRSLIEVWIIFAGKEAKERRAWVQSFLYELDISFGKEFSASICLIV